MRVAVRLGYDGPVKLFVDGRPAFHDPAGTNPAKRDSAAPEIDLTAGDHELALALGANQGRAWGVFLRLQRIDLTDGATPVLPEISR
jgi:sialate O-acetylesterase